MNKLILIITFLTSLSWALSGQMLNDLEGPSEEHVLVKGTNVFMVPPDNFEPSGDYKGFKNPEDPYSMIMLMEMPGPFDEVSKGFAEENKEAMLANGMVLISKKEFQIGTYEGLLIEMEQEAGLSIFYKTVVIYGDANNTVMINGMSLKESDELVKQIKESLKTVFVDEKMTIDPRAELSFMVDESVGGLQFIGVVGNGVLFNRDLKTPTESEDKLSLMVDKSYAKVPVTDEKAFCISRVEQFPGAFEIMEEKGINKVSIDGLDGYELHAINNEDGSEELYLINLFEEDGGYFIIFSTYLAGSESAQRDIQKVIKTFKRK